MKIRGRPSLSLSLSLMGMARTMLEFDLDVSEPLTHHHGYLQSQFLKSNLVLFLFKANRVQVRKQ